MPPLMMSQTTSSAVHFVNAQLDEAVVEQDARTLLYVFSERLEGGAHQVGRAGNVARRDGEFLAGFEHHGLVIFQLGGANLGSLQIAHDAERLALLAAYLADHLDQRQLFLVRAVGEVEAHHIHAGAHQLAEDRLGVGSRPESSDNLCAALRRGIGQAEFECHLRGLQETKAIWVRNTG
jgi:hypothetical protein